MVLERAEIVVKEDKADTFVGVMKDRGLALLASGKDCHAVKMAHGVENPAKILMLVEWESIEAHNAFRTAPQYAEFREPIGAFVTGGTMEHFSFS